MTIDPAKQLARQIADLQRQVKGISRSNSLSYSSIEGTGIPVFDDEGNLRGTIGQLPDGTTGFVTVNGPIPAAPSAPILEPTVGGLSVTWDGTFLDGADRPGDFQSIEIHAAPYSVYTPDQSTHRANLVSPGTANLILPPNPYTIVFVTRSTSDQRSEPSIPATETPEQAPSYTEVIAANGKNKVFWRKDNNPPTLADDALIDGDLWFQVDHDNKPVHWDKATSTWVDGALGDDAISGLNVGKLVAGEIAAGQAIFAGPQLGTHAEMRDTGFYVYRQDPDTGETDQVIKLGTSDDDYFAVVDSNNNLVASIDDTGSGNFNSLNVTGEARFSGRSLDDILGDVSHSTPGEFYGFPPANGSYGAYGPIQAAIGVAEVNGYLYAGREYEIRVRATAMCDVDDSVETRVYVKYTGPDADGSNTAAAPTVNSPEVDHWLKTFHAQTRWETFEFTCRFIATTNGRHRFLMAMERGALGRTGATNSSIYVRPEHLLFLGITDIGPASTVTGSFSQGGAAFWGGPPPAPPAPPTQQSYVELAPSGHNSFRGNGTLRTDTTDVVQGTDPSGYNGDGKGHWWFPMPDIHGTIDRMDLYLYSNSTYYNSGGNALITPAIAGNGGPNYDQPRGTWNPGAVYPKPGGVTVTLPADWYPLFTNSGAYGYGRADGIRVGPGGSDLHNYVRFDGPGARLRIWYTQ